MNKSQIYNLLTSHVNNSEQIRWMRFNTLLVVNSILILAWAAVFSIKPDFAYKPILLTVLCIPGFISGILWSFLGKRSSNYLDTFYKSAKGMEEEFPNEVCQPFHLIDDKREQSKKGLRVLTTSEWIVTWIPIIFSTLFLYLIFISWFDRLINPN